MKVYHSGRGKRVELSLSTVYKTKLRREEKFLEFSEPACVHLCQGCIYKLTKKNAFAPKNSHIDTNRSVSW